MSPKPDFSGITGGIVDPYFIPADVQKELVEIASEVHEASDAEAFVRACSEIAYMVLEGRRQSKLRETREQLELVADRARDLLIAMRRLGTDAVSDLEAHQAHPMSGSPNSPVQWTAFARETIRAQWPEEGLLSCSWDLIEAVEATARHAAGHLPETKHGPSLWAAQGLTRFVVQAYPRRFGKLPPKDQNGWFVAFMQRMGGEFGLQCGARPVRNAVEDEERLTPSA